MSPFFRLCCCCCCAMSVNSFSLFFTCVAMVFDSWLRSKVKRCNSINNDNMLSWSELLFLFHRWQCMPHCTRSQTHIQHNIAFNLSSWLFSYLLLAPIGALLVLVTRKIVPEFDCKSLLVAHYSVVVMMKPQDRASTADCSVPHLQLKCSTQLRKKSIDSTCIKSKNI